MAICKTCHNYYDILESTFLPAHKCHPAWLVWDPDQGNTVEDARTIYALNAEWAAEKWAEEDDSDSAEYSIAQGTSTVVCVQPKEGGPIEKFKVTGEYEPTYSAELVEEPSKESAP